MGITWALVLTTARTGITEASGTLTCITTTVLVNMWVAAEQALNTRYTREALFVYYLDIGPAEVAWSSMGHYRLDIKWSSFPARNIN